MFTLGKYVILGCIRNPMHFIETPYNQIFNIYIAAINKIYYLMIDNSLMFRISGH